MGAGEADGILFSDVLWTSPGVGQRSWPELRLPEEPDEQSEHFM